MKAGELVQKIKAKYVYLQPKPINVKELTFGAALRGLGLLYHIPLRSRLYFLQGPPVSAPAPDSKYSHGGMYLKHTSTLYW